ncbi:MAG: flagellar motor protein MotB [Pararobbsia sp.]
MPPASRKKDAEKTEKVSLLILRRRANQDEHPHHGGAWKIAYADFVTAMMAFFLLMWLLNSTNKSDKQGIADFFNRPLSVAMAGGKSSSASNSILNAGGTDLTISRPGEARHGDDSKRQNPVLVPNAMAQALAEPQPQPQPQHMTPQPVTAAAARTGAARTESNDDTQRLSALKERLDKMIEMNPKLAQFRNQIRTDITSEGLRIQIVDAQNRPMFASGRAVLEPYAKEILDQFGVALNDVENHISIAGHTDSAPYAGGESGYSNWELSSERANAARRELDAGGLEQQKVLQVRGLADALPLDKSDPAAAGNRRISILVLNKRTEDAFYRDGGRTDLGAPAQIPSALGGAAKTGAIRNVGLDQKL